MNSHLCIFDIYRVFPIQECADMAIFDPTSETLEKKATRDGYGAALMELGKSREEIVVLEADLSGSTKTKKFGDTWPERFFNFGVAEQNVVGHAAGLAMAGLVPFASSFAIFLTGRAWEIVRNSVAYPHLNVKLAATHAGITLGEDGASHQIIEDIAIMRAIPGMTILVPADYNMAKAAIHAAADFQGPVYIRLGRPALPLVYDETEKFEIGKARVLQQGDEILFCATGVLVHEAFKAAKQLEKQLNKKITVLDFGTIKPLDTETLLKFADPAKVVFTFEEHNIMGGFGSAIAETLSEQLPRKVVRIGLQDVFGQSGKVPELLQHYRLNAECIVEDVAKIIKGL